MSQRWLANVYACQGWLSRLGGKLCLGHKQGKLMHARSTETPKVGSQMFGNMLFKVGLVIYRSKLCLLVVNRASPFMGACWYGEFVLEFCKNIGCEMSN